MLTRELALTLQLIPIIAMTIVYGIHLYRESERQSRMTPVDSLLRDSDFARSAFAAAAGLSPNSVELQGAAKIILNARQWTGGQSAALNWYRNEAIPALDGLTPLELVAAGRASEVRERLNNSE